ncbi:C40 family peptidase [Mycolicibacter kumamotonensis]|uniref:C40 family peptidase n=1 Tax=Mycolicibacter kumamotonensis TaxID=354243 RepID=UPI00080655BA|nr:C40 family peptidase [Mycolicibacter kumamotonensis]
MTGALPYSTTTNTSEQSRLYDFSSRIDIDPYNPPPMKTLIYAPEIKVRIAHNAEQIDVSSDIVRARIIKEENSASTAFVTLTNKGGRYSKVISPMDRIEIWLKRLEWQQVFSGYVDTGPHSQLYPGVITIKATCTLKRLLHTWWNPNFIASQSLFTQPNFAAGSAGSGQPQYDSGLGSLLARLMMDVGNWNPANIHIANFPVTFYNFLADEIAKNSAASQTQMYNFKRLLLGDDTAIGHPNYASYNPGAAQRGAVGIGMPFYVNQIIAACDDMGMGPVALDLQTSQTLEEAAALGQEGNAAALGSDSNQKAAWEQLGQAAQNIQSATRNQDGAILGVAAAMAMGNGVILNRTNPAVPDSLQYIPNDGPGNTGTALGIFQMQNFAQWGSAGQRMNPYQASTLFFQQLKKLSWRNMDPGEAIQRALQAGSSVLFDGFVTAATDAVKAARGATDAAAQVIASNPLSGTVSNVAGVAGINLADMADAAVEQVTQSPSAASVSAVAGRPVPDSELAVMLALAQAGKPYQYGATGPAAFDCSGLMVFAYRASGITLPRTTQAMYSTLQHVPPSNIQRGDLIITNGLDHVVMYIAPGVCFAASDYGIPIGFVPMPTEIDAVLHICANGGADPSLPIPDPSSLGPGMPPGTSTSTGVDQGTGGTHDEPIARNLFAYMYYPGEFLSPTADFIANSGGHKEFIDSQPLIQMVQSLCKASLRNFQSAPNGDFCAYYPDYFGLDHKPAVMKLEDIELKDVHIDISDDQLTTHVYVNGQTTTVGNMDQVSSWITSAGVATVEDEWLFQRLRNVAIDQNSSLTGQMLLQKYGVRPYQISTNLTGSRELEFMMACQIFMQKWAQQYQTSVSFTFLPELLPSMRIVFSDHKLQVYVSRVVHDIDMEHGYTTTATICAPSNPSAADMMAKTTTSAASLSAGSIGVDLLKQGRI